MTPFPLRAGIFFALRPFAASGGRGPARPHCPASCRACRAVPGAALPPPVPAAPAFPAVFPGFRALVSSPGFWRAVPWLPAAFSGDFLFHDSCPAPFVCVGCPLFPAVFGHAWCGFRRGFLSMPFPCGDSLLKPGGYAWLLRPFHSALPA